MENNIKALFIVVNAGFADEVVEIARNAGSRGATILNSRGENNAHKSFLGITLDSEKEMVLTLVNSEVANKIITGIKENFGLLTPARGICFTLPVEKYAGIAEEEVKSEELNS